MPLIIPEGVSNYFEMTNYSQGAGRLDIFLEEMNVIPEEFEHDKLVSRGFFESVNQQDFPIRGNKSIFMLNVVDGLTRIPTKWFIGIGI